MKMKGSLLYAFLLIPFASVFAAGGKCHVDFESVCECPATLTLVSKPDQYVVDADNCNSQYNKLDWQEEPRVSFKDAQPGKKYTLLCVDPDPPAYLPGQYFLHWLVHNISGESFVEGDLSKAEHVKSYYGPAPPSGSGVHRYMFVAFEEEDENVRLENPSGRGKFELKSWLDKHEKLKGPVAGVQFRTQY